MRKYLQWGLVVACLMAYLAFFVCVEWYEAYSLAGWLGVLALLLSGVLLLIWGIRLLCGLYRWHPAVREVLMLVLAALLICWDFRGFVPITWYRLDVACCSAVGTTPTWHVSPLKRAWMAVSDDWSEGRFGLRLEANDEEFHQNYNPRVGHGLCRVEFSHYTGFTKAVRDAFTLDLRPSGARCVRLNLAADSSALGVIVLPGKNTYEAYAPFLESNLEPREWAESAGCTWHAAHPGESLELPVENNCVCFLLVYCPGVEDDKAPELSPYEVLPFGVARE